MGLIIKNNQRYKQFQLILQGKFEREKTWEKEYNG